MKAVYFSVIILILILMFGYFHIHYTVNLSNKYLLKMDELEKDMDIAIIDAIMDSWIKDSRFNQTFFDHNKTDSICIYLLRIKEYLNKGDYANAKAEISTLRYSFENLPQNIFVNIRNIL